MSKFVVPEFIYNKAEPNKIKHDDNPPNRKYVRPLEVLDSESLYKVDNMYKP